MASIYFSLFFLYFSSTFHLLFPYFLFFCFKTSSIFAVSLYFIVEIFFDCFSLLKKKVFGNIDRKNHQVNKSFSRFCNFLLLLFPIFSIFSFFSIFLISDFWFFRDASNCPEEKSKWSYVLF